LVFTEDYNPENRPITSQILLGSSNNTPALFNLQDDPSERINLINQHPSIAKELESKFKDWLEIMREGRENYSFNNN
jgi:hypothetical protein